MSLGFSIGDFIAVGNLAWGVYKTCKGAGGEFVEISKEVNALYTILKELRDEIDNPESVFHRTEMVTKQELGLLANECDSLLQSLKNLLTNYRSLGTSNERTWDKLRFGAGGLQEIKDKLVKCNRSLTLYLTFLNTGSLWRIERKLDEVLANGLVGWRADTVLSTVETDDGSEIQWNKWKKDLGKEGFSNVELETHKDWIISTLLQRILSKELVGQPSASTNGLLLAAKGGTSDSHGQKTTFHPFAIDIDRSATSSQYETALDNSQQPYSSCKTCSTIKSGSRLNDTSNESQPRDFIFPNRSDEVHVLLEAQYNSSYFSRNANQKEPAQPFRLQSDRVTAHPPSAGYIFNSPNHHYLQSNQPDREGTTQLSSRGVSPSSLVQQNAGIVCHDTEDLWPPPLEPSYLYGAKNALAFPGQPGLASEAVIGPQASPAVFSQDLNIMSESLSSLSIESTAQNVQSDSGSSGSELLSLDVPHHMTQIRSIDSRYDFEFISPSISHFSQTSQTNSKSHTTRSSSSSITRPPSSLKNSTVKRVDANHEFIDAATLASDYDMKNLSSWSKLHHVRPMINEDTISMVLIKLATNTKKSKWQVKAAESLIENFGHCLNGRDHEHQRTPLIWAVLNDHEAIMRLLLSNGASLAARDGEFLRTPLAWAATHGAWYATSIFLKEPEARLFINAKDKDGKTALDIAENKGFMKTKQILLRHGAQRGVDSSTPVPQL